MLKNIKSEQYRGRFNNENSGDECNVVHNNKNVQIYQCTGFQGFLLEAPATDVYMTGNKTFCQN